MDLSIKPIANNGKDRIKQPPLAQKDIIPRLGNSVLLVGCSGSGKSTLLARFLTDRRFFKGAFDRTYLFSPTAGGDDVQKQFGVKRQHIINDPDRDGAKILKVIIDAQTERIEKVGAAKAPQLCIIFDDIIGAHKFLRTKEFSKMFFMSRHVNCTVFICAQSYNSVTRVCRLQTRFIAFFKGSQSEVEILAREYCPPGLSKRRFMSMVSFATDEPHSFLVINKNVPPAERFRKRLGEIIKY